MKNILWFCRSGDSSSLARITDSLLPCLKNNYNITLFGNQCSLGGIKNVVIGADTDTITFNDFAKTMPKDTDARSMKIKYIMVQLVDLIYNGDFDYLVICNGIYEINWMTGIITGNPIYTTNSRNKKTKLIVWAPIDYIPSRPVIDNALKADIFLTMNPVMAEEIKKLSNGINIGWIGHGSDIKTGNTIDRNQLVEELNQLRKKKIITCKHPLSVDDVIILNANNYGPIDDNAVSTSDNSPGTRKRLDITVRAFLKLLTMEGMDKTKLKLWIHTDLKSFFRMLSIEGILLTDFSENVILSNNTVSDEQLAMIYQMSNISLQTSTGEGWSLTNLEASLHRSLQVVPDFLACGHHYSNGRGILIPVTRKQIKNEGGLDVTIGEVSVNDTVEKLLYAIKLKKEEFDEMLDNAYNYASNYRWKTISDQFTFIMG